MIARVPTPQWSSARSGITLLEVLVACGLLVISLASIAALLPAAGSRLSQATQADRAGLMAANAYAEIMNRGLLSATIYSGITATGTSSVALPPRTYAFGRMLDRLVVSNVSPATKGKGRGKKPGTAVDNLVAAPHEDNLYARIDFDRGFSLEDDLELAEAVTATEPLSLFNGGYRNYRDGFCWGATLTIPQGPVVAGTAAELSIVIFKKESLVSTDPDTVDPVTGLGAPKPPITLTRAASPLYTVDEAARQDFLPACSYALIISPTSNGLLPKWTKVTASWRNEEDPGQGLVVLDLAAAYRDGDLTTIQGSDLRIVGFASVVRVDTYSVRLTP